MFAKTNKVMILKYSVGLDVGSKQVHACISTIDHNQEVKVKSTCSIDNSRKGFLFLKRWITKHSEEKSIPLVICIEATGVYHENLSYYLVDEGFNLSIVLPNKAKKYLQAIGIKSKNDKIHAIGLAQMGAEQNLKLWQKPSEAYLSLRALTRQYQDVQESITSEKNKLHAIEHGANSNKVVLNQHKGIIKFLEKQKKELEKAISAAVKSNDEIRSKVDNIIVIRGLSILSIATIIAETNGFDLFNNYKQLVSYAGYDVVENQSGAHRGKTKISKKGNSRIRRILHMPALIAMQTEGSIFQDLYQRVYDRTGIKMKGIVAVQKKLLVIIYALWKKNEAFDSNYNYGQSSNIQEKKQESTSRESSNGAQKDSQTNNHLSTQGIHPVSYHSMSPLGRVKIMKNDMKKENTG